MMTMCDDPRLEDWLFEVIRWLVAFAVAGAMLFALWLGIGE